jgi:hypothetical protein
MTINFISRRAALLLLHKTDDKGRGFAFSLTFVTADLHRKTGGQLLTLPNCVLNKNSGQAKKSRTRHFEGGKAGSEDSQAWTTQTINILDLDANKIIAVHIQLLLRVNGLRIIP